jgi:hypothetical protein
VDQWKQLRLVGSNRTFPLTLGNAQIILVRALEMGSVHITDHFKQRAKERRFTTIDAERIIKTGKIVCEPEYSLKHDNWFFRIRGRCEKRTLEMRIALDCRQDYETPLVILITGVCNRR